MDSIFDKTGNAAIIARINTLTTESKALWGKMTVDQMCKHCTSAINVAFGKQDVKVNFLIRFLGKMLKDKVFNSEFKKNSPTAKEFVFTNQYDLEISKKEFFESFSLFAQGHQAIKVIDHPFWGKMTYEDWDKLMWKHVDHHLKQFSV
jgi:hypothetical protein